MDADIYRSLTNPRKFVVVPAGLAPTAIPIPDADLANLEAVRLRCRFDADLLPGRPDAAVIAREIESQGFAVFCKP